MKLTLYIALIVSLVTYLFWSYMPKGFFYYGNALFILLLTGYIYYKNRSLFVAFLLFANAINNFLDEILFDNTKIGINELSLLIIFPAIWYFKNRKKYV